MDTRKNKPDSSRLDVQVIVSDIRSEIDLEDRKLLKLEIGQAGARVACTTGTLWLTQEDDLHDHFLKAGQSFTLVQGGIVLVQGLPCGKAIILPQPAALEPGQQPSYNKGNCSGQWDPSLEAEYLL